MRWFICFVSLLLLTGGCARSGHHKGVISEALPLSMKDIDEIRAGDEAHVKLFKEKEYRLYPSPELSAYVAHVGRRIAKVSDRPNLPYQFFIIDSDRVDIFGLGGGKVYVTMGLLNFVESESELAGGLAHEIGHITSLHYLPQRRSRWERVYDLMLKGAEQAKGAAPPYTSGLPYGVKALRFSVVEVRKRFNVGQEKEADERAIRYLVKAGYDPKDYQKLVEKLSQVTVTDVGYFVDLLKAHTPVQGRRKLIEEKIKDAEKESRKKKKEKEKTSLVPYLESVLVDPEFRVSNLPTQKENIPTVETKAFASQS
jgi:predicted Zn-dependent protease